MQHEVLTKNLFYKITDINSKVILYCKFIFQPIICPRTKKNYAFEVLTRFENDDIEIELFFKKAPNDIIKKIIQYQVKEINSISNSKSVLFTINCSSEVMADNFFINKIMKCLTKKVAFELTTMPTTKCEQNRLIKTIRDIKQSGHKIWLDDFLSEEVPRYALDLADWDLVKFDKSVLYNYLDSPSKMFNLITSLSDVGVSRFIFEGVETEYQHQTLLIFKGLHQGFLYSYPIELSSLLKVST